MLRRAMSDRHEHPDTKKNVEKIRTQTEIEHRSEQLNPNNPDYWKSRGWRDRPENWKKRVTTGKTQPSK